MTVIKSIDQSQANKSRHPEVDQSNPPPQGAQRSARHAAGARNTPRQPRSKRKVKIVSFPFSAHFFSFKEKQKQALPTVSYTERKRLHAVQAPVERSSP